MVNNSIFNFYKYQMSSLLIYSIINYNFHWQWFVIVALNMQNSLWSYIDNIKVTSHFSLSFPFSPFLSFFFFFFSLFAFEVHDTIFSETHYRLHYLVEQFNGTSLLVPSGIYSRNRTSMPLVLHTANQTLCDLILNV